MTDIDWSEAPEWANAVIASTDDSLYWVAQWGGKSARQLVGEQAISDHVADMNNPHKWRLLGTRPTPPCSGDGLPPVGTECEHKGNAPGNDDWTLVSILAHSKSMGQHVAVFQHGDHISYSSERYFRPIKTPAQIAAEEREAAAVELAGILSGHDQHITVLDIEMAKYLYDIGYRRTEKGDDK